MGAATAQHDPNQVHLSAIIALIIPAGLVWAVTPLSWLQFLHFLFKQTYPISACSIWHKISLYHSFFEVPFSIYLYRLARQAQKKPDLKFASLDEMRRIFQDCMQVGAMAQERQPGVPVPRREEAMVLDWDSVDETRAEMARLKFRGWFIGKPPIEQVHRDNVVDWLSWALIDGTPEDLKSNPGGKQLIEEGVGWIENRIHHKFKPGYNQNLKAIRLTHDPVRTLHRPFGYYVVCNAVTLLTYAFLLLNGCKFERYGECSWITRSARPNKKTKSKSGSKLPVVFIHGLGIGLGQYLTFLGQWMQEPLPLAILIQPNISTQIYDSRFIKSPGKEAHVDSFKALCKAKGWSGVTILSHSNGTMVHGWLLRGAKELCQRNLLTDPVSFRLWEADVAHSFVHQKWRTYLEVLLGYFVARELGTAHTIARAFVWTDMMLWIHEFPSTQPKDLQIILAENDFLTDAPGVVSYLHEVGVEDECITLVKGAQHGAALIAPQEGMKKVFESL